MNALLALLAAALTSALPVTGEERGIATRSPGARLVLYPDGLVGFHYTATRVGRLSIGGIR